MNLVGFSVIYLGERGTGFYAELLRGMIAAGCNAIELHTPRHDTLDDPELIDLMRRFEYRAIHTSDLHSAEEKEILAYYQGLAQRIGAAAITIHPHTMSSWEWIADCFGDRASFENMDRFKPFGKTPMDMQRIKLEHPTARWTFDLNHVYTNDPSLSQAVGFYEKLGNPGHYHVSGFKDEKLPHTTLHTTKQNGIIAAIATTAPIIIESLGTEDIHLFREEYDYVMHVLFSRSRT